MSVPFKSLTYTPSFFACLWRGNRWHARYAAWERLVEELPLVHDEGQTGWRQRVKVMEVVLVEEEAVEVLRRVYVVLGMLVHAYVNGGGAREVPRGVAVPFRDVCGRLVRTGHGPAVAS